MSLEKSNYYGISLIAIIIIVVFAGSFILSAVFAREAQTGMPTYPHLQEGYLETECIACHQRGIKQAPLFNHPDRGSCLSCHS